MGLMQRFILKFSFFVSVIALLSALFSGVSIQTSVIRASVTLLGTMLLFIILLNVMRWAIITTTVIENHGKEEDRKKEEAAGLKKNSEEHAALESKDDAKQLSGISK